MKTPTLLANRKYPNTTGWQDRHDAAVLYSVKGPDHSILTLLRGWSAYAEEHRKRYHSKIGEDYVLGPEWEKIGRGIRGLLNGELGRLDGGTLDAYILDTLHSNGIEEE